MEQGIPSLKYILESSTTPNWPHIQVLSVNRDTEEDKRGAAEYTDLHYMRRIRVDAKRI